jgi:hypothetical protein
MEQRPGDNVVKKSGLKGQLKKHLLSYRDFLLFSINNNELIV